MFRGPKKLSSSHFGGKRILSELPKVIQLVGKFKTWITNSSLTSVIFFFFLQHLSYLTLTVKTGKEKRPSSLTFLFYILNPSTTFWWTFARWEIHNITKAVLVVRSSQPVREHGNKNPFLIPNNSNNNN